MLVDETILGHMFMIWMMRSRVVHDLVIGVDVGALLYIASCSSH